MIYLVSYNATISAEVKMRIETGLRTMPGWWHHLETTWIVASEQNIKDVTDFIHNLAASDDRFIVIDITFKAYNGWLPTKAWNWLQNENNREQAALNKDSSVGVQPSTSEL